MATTYHADGTRTQGHPSKRETRALNYTGLTPAHRPYQGGCCLVRLTRNIIVIDDATAAVHDKGTQLLARNINPAKTTARGKAAVTRLYYPKSDAKRPGQVVKATRDDFTVVEYDFRRGDFTVVVRDHRHHQIRPEVRFIVTRDKFHTDVHAVWRADCGPTVNYGTRGTVSIAEARQACETIQLACALAEAEAATHEKAPLETKVNRRIKGVVTALKQMRR